MSKAIIGVVLALAAAGFTASDAARKKGYNLIMIGYISILGLGS